MHTWGIYVIPICNAAQRLKVPGWDDVAMRLRFNVVNSISNVQTTRLFSVLVASFYFAGQHDLSCVIRYLATVLVS